MAASQDVEVISIADGTWEAINQGGARTIRLQGDKTFDFVHGDTSNGGFTVAAGTPVEVDAGNLHVYAPSGGGTVSLKVQRVR